MLYYDYWPCCCRPKVAGFVIPVYLNGYAMIVSSVCAYLLTLDGDCFQVTGLLGEENCLSRTFVIVTLIWHLLQLVANFLVLWGVSQKDRRFLLPWLVMFGILWAGCLLYAFADFFVGGGRIVGNDDDDDDKAVADGDNGDKGEEEIFGPANDTQARMFRQMWMVILAATFMYLWATILDLYFRMNPTITDDKVFEGVSVLDYNKANSGSGGESV